MLDFARSAAAPRIALACASAQLVLLLQTDVPHAAATATTADIAPGVSLPLVTFGTSDVTDPALCELMANEAGVISFDTSIVYSNASHQCVRRALATRPRSDVFVTQKVHCSGFNLDGSTYPFSRREFDDLLQSSLDVLGASHVDLLLMHWPCDALSDTLRAYSQLEAFARRGHARAVGLSNTNLNWTRIVRSRASLVPAVSQCHFSVGSNYLSDHPPFSAAVLTMRGPDGSCGLDSDTIASNVVTYMAYSPLRLTTSEWAAPPLLRAAAAHGKSVAQVALRWIVQQGVAVVTSSNSVAHVRESEDVVSFELSAKEMRELSALHSGMTVSESS